MLKSRGRTNEVPVMGMEEWPQVVIATIFYSIAIRITSKTKRVAQFRNRRSDAYQKRNKENFCVWMTCAMQNTTICKILLTIYMPEVWQMKLLQT